MTTVTQCPWWRCTAPLVMLKVPISTDPREGAVTMVPRHQVHPDSQYGECPASLMNYPLSEEQSALLRRETATFDRIIGERRHSPGQALPGVDDPPNGTLSDPSDEGDPDAPWRKARWFTDLASGDMPQWRAPGEIGPVAHPENLHDAINPAPTAAPSSGSEMATAAEIIAFIDTIDEKISEAMQQAKRAGDEFEQALTMQRALQSLTSNELGAPHLQQAIDATENAIIAGAAAVEENETYRSTL